MKILKTYLFELKSYDSKIHVTGNFLSELVDKMSKFYPDEEILANLEDDMRYLLRDSCKKYAKFLAKHSFTNTPY